MNWTKTARWSLTIILLSIAFAKKILLSIGPELIRTPLICPPADQLDVNHTLEDLMDALEVAFHSDL
jgi:hypothetical protein